MCCSAHTLLMLNEVGDVRNNERVRTKGDTNERRNEVVGYIGG